MIDGGVGAVQENAVGTESATGASAAALTEARSEPEPKPEPGATEEDSEGQLMSSSTSRPANAADVERAQLVAEMQETERQLAALDLLSSGPPSVSR